MEYKSVNEYLLALSDELKYMSPKDATKVLKFYENKISVALDYGEKEEAVLNSLPTPEEVAKEAYESHGIKYLELKKKQYKRKQTFRKIFDVILSIMALIAFGVVTYLVGFQIIKKINLISLLSSTKNSLITILGVIFLIISILILFIYVIDLFIIILEFLCESYIPIKDTDKKRKILSFNITTLVNELFKKEKVILKAGLISLIICVVFLITSFATKGYVYNSLMDKTSYLETINIDNSISNLTIKSDILNLEIKNTIDSFISYEYNYEFKHEFNQTINSDSLIIDIPTSESFDILDLLKEPTQSIVLYIPEASSINLNIESDKLNLVIDRVSINDLTIKSDINIECVISNCTISRLDATCNNAKFGLVTSNISTFNYEVSKGQLLIEDETIISDALINNKSSIINLTKSTITNLIINNTSGTVSLEEVKCDVLTFNTKTSTSTIDYCLFKDATFDIYNTCSLTLEHSIVENKIDAKVSSEAYFITDYVMCPDIEVNATSGYIFLNRVGIDYIQKEYTNTTFNMSSNVSIYNESNSSKTEVNECKLDELYINSTMGYVLVLDSDITKGTLSLNSVNICDLENNIGGTIFLYLKTIGSSISLKNNLDTSVLYKVIKWDELSCARLSSEDSVNLDTSEATNNE